MSAVWDESKRAANRLKHGYDFADFETSFDAETAVYRQARPSRIGWTRYLLIGDWNGQIVVTVIVSPLGSEALSIVSIRTASSKERAAYERQRSQV